MNRLIQKFGSAVGARIPSRPHTALFLLNAAYAANELRSKYFPDSRLLPHQQYAAQINNRTIREPLVRPEDSAVINVFIPCELLQAAGITPQFVEALSGFLNGAGCERAFIDYAENYGVPQTYCSYHKTLLGAALSLVLPQPRFIVNTTLACDANTNTFRLLSDFWQAPHFTVDVPRTYSEENVAYVAAQLREMAAFIEKITGRKQDREALRMAIRRGNNSVRMYREYFRELAGKRLPNNFSSEMFKITLTHVRLGTPEAEEYFRLLLDDVRRAPAAGREIRILWVHTLPFWQESLRGVFEGNAKYQLLCSDINFDSLCELDEDRPYVSMARRLLANSLGGSARNRAERVLEMAKSLRADGVVYFCHWGCKQTLGGAALTEELLAKEGIGTLVLDGDGCDRENVNDGQMSTRLQAFLEILEARK